MIRCNNIFEEEQLRIKPLKVGFIKKDFIENFETNYEEYLTEFINCSKFVVDNGNKKFKIISKQSNGECDITNSQYVLDYKLLIDNKTIENMYYYSENIAVHTDGVVSYSASKKSGNFRIYILLNILKSLSKEDFEKINATEKDELNEVQKLVKNYINKIKKDKNILYFIPYNLYFKNRDMDIDMINSVVDMLSDGLNGFLKYRNSNTNNRDTYFSFVSNDNMIFLKYEGKLKLYDIVALKESKLYSEIADLNDSWGFQN